MSRKLNITCWALNTCSYRSVSFFFYDRFMVNLTKKSAHYSMSSGASSWWITLASLGEASCSTRRGISFPSVSSKTTSTSWRWTRWTSSTGISLTTTHFHTRALHTLTSRMCVYICGTIYYLGVRRPVRYTVPIYRVCSVSIWGKIERKSP